MATIFLIIAALAMIHFVYEGIIGPSIRMRLRYQIFAQRDALRALKISHGKAISEQAFKSLHDSLNTAIRLLPAINVTTLAKSRKAFEQDANLRHEVEMRDEMLRSIGMHEIDEIRNKTRRTVMLGLLANTAGLFLCLLPMIVAILCVRWTANIIKEILLIPNRQFDSIFSLPQNNGNSSWCAQ